MIVGDLQFAQLTNDHDHGLWRLLAASLWAAAGLRGRPT